jgi:hypothetical protein
MNFYERFSRFKNTETHHYKLDDNGHPTIPRTLWDRAHKENQEFDARTEKLWAQAHRENEEFDRFGKVLTRTDAAFARCLTTAVRIFIVFWMQIIWMFVVGPIWLAMLGRTMTAFIWANIAAIFSGAGPVQSQRLQYVVDFWMAGFLRIEAIRLGKVKPTPPVPISTAELIRETLLSVAFVAAICLSYFIFDLVFQAIVTRYRLTPMVICWQKCTF